MLKIQMDDSSYFRQILASEHRMGPVVQNLDTFQCYKALKKVNLCTNFRHCLKSGRAINRIQISCLKSRQTRISDTHSNPILKKSRYKWHTNMYSIYTIWNNMKTLHDVPNCMEKDNTYKHRPMLKLEIIFEQCCSV